MIKIRNSLILLLTACLILLSSLFTACDPEEKEYPTLEYLDPAIALEIKKTVLENIKDESLSLSDVFIVSYSGTYNDCVIVMTDVRGVDYTTAIETVEIDGVTFTYGSGNKDVAWKDGRFYSLSEAYEKGFISRQDLLAIKYYHDKNGTNKYLSEEDERRIKQAYFDYYLSDDENASIFYVGVVNYYGSFDGSEAVILSYSYTTDVIMEETVCGKKFIYNSDDKILLLRDGSFYSLQEAFDRGYVTEENVVAIWNGHKDAHSYLYKY